MSRAEPSGDTVKPQMKQTDERSRQQRASKGLKRAPSLTVLTPEAQTRRTDTHTADRGSVSETRRLPGSQIDPLITGRRALTPETSVAHGDKQRKDVLSLISSPGQFISGDQSQDVS